jgi:hypothetical protein
VTAEFPVTGSGWTLDTWAVHSREMAQLQERLDAERDRRYAEVNTEKEKALKIKEEADKAALGLAREIQTYKDEKANELREQINSERGLYATKGDLQAAVEKIEAGLHSGSLDARSLLFAVLGVILALGVVISPHIH